VLLARAGAGAHGRQSGQLQGARRGRGTNERVAAAAAAERRPIYRRGMTRASPHEFVAR
jgi:hypothetical protein